MDIFIGAFVGATYLIVFSLCKAASKGENL